MRATLFCKNTMTTSLTVCPFLDYMEQGCFLSFAPDVDPIIPQIGGLSSGVVVKTNFESTHPYPFTVADLGRRTAGRDDKNVAASDITEHLRALLVSMNAANAKLMTAVLAGDRIAVKSALLMGADPDLPVQINDPTLPLHMRTRTAPLRIAAALFAANLAIHGENESAQNVFSALAEFRSAPETPAPFGSSPTPAFLRAAIGKNKHPVLVGVSPGVIDGQPDAFRVNAPVVVEMTIDEMDKLFSQPNLVIEYEGSSSPISGVQSTLSERRSRLHISVEGLPMPSETLADLERNSARYLARLPTDSGDVGDARPSSCRSGP